MCFALKAGAKVGAFFTASNYFCLFFMLKNIKKTIKPYYQADRVHKIETRSTSCNQQHKKTPGGMP